MGFWNVKTASLVLQVGVYNHVPGDGREFVCCDESAVKIRAEDGRFIAGVDISAFINGLPHGKPTGDFSTDDASVRQFFDIIWVHFSRNFDIIWVHFSRNFDIIWVHFSRNFKRRATPCNVLHVVTNI